MPPRKNQQRGSLDSVLECLPDRFREAEVYADHGVMTGLRAYVDELSEHLRRELGLAPHEEPPTIEVMTMLGIPPSEWYRALLQR